MMKNKLRKISAVSVLLISSVALTACDPPMPPELLAQLAEQSYTCIEGEVKVYSENAFSAITDSMIESLATSCVDTLPAMSMIGVETAKGADLVIGSEVPAECIPFQSVPFGFDAGVVAYNVDGVDSLNLTYKTMAKLLNGEITSWDDAAIAKENPDLELTPIPVVVRKVADKNSLAALKAALGYQSASLNDSTFTAKNFYNGQAIQPLTAGELAIVPNSLAVNEGLLTVGLLTGTKNKETGDVEYAVPSEESLNSAGTQLVVKKAGTTITMVVDPKVAPKAQFEGEAVPAPYQAIFPINLYLCGKDNLITRAVAGFMLRLDSQGSLGYVNLNQLPEAIRYESVAAVRKGLPTPKATKKSE